MIFFTVKVFITVDVECAQNASLVFHKGQDPRDNKT